MSISLEPFTQEDIPDLISWVDSKELHELWTGKFFSYPLQSNQIVQHLEESKRDFAQHRMYTIKHSSHGSIGYGELSHIWPHLSARISRLLIGPEERRGQGFGLLATKELASLAFSEFDLHRLDLGVMSSNLRAIKTYESAGFVTVGEWEEFPGGRLCWMSLRESR